MKQCSYFFLNGYRVQWREKEGRVIHLDIIPANLRSVWLTVGYNIS